MPRRSLERIRISVDVETLALDPWRVASATNTDVSSHATLVCTFVVLELDTKFLITSLESELRFVLLHQSRDFAPAFEDLSDVGWQLVKGRPRYLKD